MGQSLKRNAFYNVLKQCCNIIFPLITYPYVSRVLLSSGMGKLSFADSIITLSMTIAGLGINTYGVREGARIRKKREEIELFSAQIFTINILSTIVVYIVLGVLLIILPRFQRDYIIILILSFNIICNTLSRDWINQIYEDYKYITIRYIVFQTLALVLTFLCIHSPDDYIKYALIMLLANSGGYVTSIVYTRKYVPLRVTTNLNLKKQIKPIMYLLGVTLAVQVYVKSDIVVLGFYKSDKEVGIYTIASKVYIIIKTLLNAIISVTIPRLANYYGNDNIESYKKLLYKLQNWLIVITFPFVVGTFFLSKEVLLIIGGDGYTKGMQSLQILSVTLIFSVFACYYANCFLVVRRKDSMFFKSTLLSAFVNIILNIILVPYLGMCGAAITTLIAEFIVFIILLHYSKEVEIASSKICAKSVVFGCFGVFVVCLLMRIVINDVFYRFILTLLISIIVYYIINKLLKNPVIKEIELSVSNTISRNKLK